MKSSYRQIIAAYDRSFWEALWPHGLNARSSPNRALALKTLSSLAQPLSTQEYKPCDDGSVSHLGGVEVLLVASCF